MNKPELLVSAGSIEEVKALAEAGADAVMVGESRYGMRLPGDMTPQEIGEAVTWAHGRGIKIYVSVNSIMDNDQVKELPEYLKAVADIGVDGIVFGDPAVLMVAREVAPGLALHWNAEMTSTNYVTANYWGEKGATRAVLARELNMDEVLEFRRNCRLQVEVQVHGMTNIYHSKRLLVRSYIEHRDLNATVRSDRGDVDPSIESGLYLIEQERPDERFPIYEDSSGTNVMSSDDICMIEDLHELIGAGIDSLRIETIMKPLDYNVTVVRSYRQAIDAYVADPENYTFNDEWVEAIRQLQAPDRELTFGFFYKEQVY